MKLKIPSPLVSVNWLHENIEANNLIILDASIAKVGMKERKEAPKKQLKNSIFFDLKNVFLNKEGEFPNTIPTEDCFEEQVQKLGINKDSCVILYDDLGVYSSPRAWWLFRVFGFENVAVLNGGLPKWKELNLPTEMAQTKQLKQGKTVAKSSQ